MSDELPTEAASRPPLPLLLALCAALALGPLALPSGVGAFRMFTAPVEYRLDLAIEGERGYPRRLPARSLWPHLGRDARRVIGVADEWTLGETNAALLRAGLDDVGALVCALTDATTVRLVLSRRHLDRTPIDRTDRAVACER
ncbi:MAG: hypothetical protein GWN07_01995 [Actinobacteria bacterium]|nr:hypothetical protein [Actinomycetota bacterium]NIW26107.1 hypothetical protein [Actinomycetota bacterium]NIX18677.1 hypothetical protein [Actinomycetota bacterium]